MTNPVRLKLITAISVVIGCVIGSGVFVKPGRVLVATGSSNLAILAWILGGIISLAGGLTIAEIAFRIPKTGGVYTYMEELYGKTMGFVCGWVQTVIYGPALFAALAMFFASLLIPFLGLSEGTLKPISLIAVYLLAAICAISTKTSALIQNATTLIKLLPILAIGILGLFMGEQTIFGVALPEVTERAGLSAAVLATLWAYDGWMQVANIAGELENPAKNLPRAIVIGILTVMSAYLLVNISLFHVLDHAQIAELGERAASQAAVVIFGSIGGTLISLGILVSIFGALNGNILTMVRVPFAIANRSLFPCREKFATLHPKFQTPTYSIILQSVVATIMILLLDPNRITDIGIFSMYLFYGVVFIGIFKVRKQYGAPKAGEYKVPLYPFIPLIAIAGCLFITYGMIQQSAVSEATKFDPLISILIAAAGYPIYKFLEYKNKKA
ncbi:MAG: amino acid permease [Bacteriovoracaceae bacterium]|nr:amino acid permease [Bacteriovoracaceae bacterium]